MWDRFFHFPSEGRHAEDYSNTRKIQRLRPGSNPRPRVPEASMLNTRPPKPVLVVLVLVPGDVEILDNVLLCKYLKGRAIGEEMAGEMNTV